jgi:hypothetical protein
MLLRRKPPALIKAHPRHLEQRCRQRGRTLESAMPCVVSRSGNLWTVDVTHPCYPKRISFSGYSRPKRSDIAVVVGFFSPAGFLTPIHNARRVLADLRGAGIPVFLTELLYPGQSPQLTGHAQILSAASPMFHCENIWNLTLRLIPQQYSKLIFLDADIRFSLPDWLDRSSAVLDEADVMQPMDWCDWGSGRAGKISTAAAFLRGMSIDLTRSHPGFAFGARREWVERSGGLFSRGPLGGSDTVRWAGILRATHILQRGLHADLKSLAIKHVADSSPASVGVAEGCAAMHMPHGLAANRQYSKRYEKYIIQGGLRENSQGVYEWENSSDAAQALKYFESRAEDGGAGSILRGFLGRLGLSSGPQCKCLERAAEMDYRGSAWCRDNADLIVGWLAEEAARRKMPFCAKISRLLVLKCAQKAEKLEARRMLRAPKIRT